LRPRMGPLWQSDANQTAIFISR